MSKWRIYFFLYFVLTFSFFFYLFRNHDLFASIEKIGVERGETNTWVRKLSLIIIIIFLIILSFNFNLIQISFFFFLSFSVFFFFFDLLCRSGWNGWLPSPEFFRNIKSVRNRVYNLCSNVTYCVNASQCSLGGFLTCFSYWFFIIIIYLLYFLLHFPRISSNWRRWQPPRKIFFFFI